MFDLPFKFLFTIIGMKTEALAIKQKCTTFLIQLNLTLNCTTVTKRL
jgi:hypothetical protein